MKSPVMILSVIILLVATLTFAPVAQACSQPPPEPDIWVDIHGFCCFGGVCWIYAWITFHNFSTFGSNGQTFCACGLSKVGGIQAVLSASLVDSSTGAVIQEFDFQLDAGASASADGLLVGDDVQGFIADVQSAIPDGVQADLMFDVVLADGTTEADVQNGLLNSGGPTLVTGEADANGNFIGHVGTLPSPEPCSPQPAGGGLDGTDSQAIPQPCKEPVGRSF